MEFESKYAIELFSRDGIVVISGKYEAFAVDQKRNNYRNGKIQACTEDIQIVSSNELLRLQ